MNSLLEVHFIFLPWNQGMAAAIPCLCKPLPPYLSDQVAPAALLHGGGAAVHLPLPGGGRQAAVVEGLAADLGRLAGQHAGRLLRRRPPHLPLLVVAGVAAAGDRQELRLLGAAPARLVLGFGQKTERKSESLSVENQRIAAR